MSVAPRGIAWHPARLQAVEWTEVELPPDAPTLYFFASPRAFRSQQ